MPRPGPDPRDAAAPSSGSRPIEAVGTSVAAFVGLAEAGPVAVPSTVHSWPAFERGFGAAAALPLRAAVHDFFLNGGQTAVVVRVDAGLEGVRQGLAALEPAVDANLLVLADVADPASGLSPDAGRAAVADAAALCERVGAMLLLDPPAAWTSAHAVLAAATSGGGLATALGTDSSQAVVYFPRMRRRDQLGAGAAPAGVAASGAIAGVIARIDAAAGVWTAPAGADAVLRGATGVDVQLRQEDFTRLGGLGVNCLRELPGGGTVVWGARTLQGGDGAASEWRYVSVRRTALFLEQSIGQGLEWARFEPNAEPLWEAVRRVVAEFLLGLFRAGAFRGRSPDEAFFVRCGRDTMTQDDVDDGRLIVEIGFAPARPAEFVIIRIGSHARPAAR